MNSVEAEQLFQEWLTGLTGDPGLDVDLDGGSLEWLREVHRLNGAVTTRWLNRLVFERRRRLAEDLVAEIRLQAETELGPLDGLAAYVWEPPGPAFPAGVIMVADTAVRGVDRAGAAVEVDDGVQTAINRSRHLIWPQCPDHGNGLHPGLHDGTAQWMCRSGPHPLRHIVS